MKKGVIYGLLVLMGVCSCTLSKRNLGSMQSDVAPKLSEFVVPEGFDIKSIDLENTSDSISRDDFVKVLAVERNTNDYYLFVYANRPDRYEPLQVIRLKTISKSSFFNLFKK